MAKLDKPHSLPWIHSPGLDSVFILAPAFLCLVLVLFIPSAFHDHAEVTLPVYVLLVLGIDVAHVYSTLYRTYFDQEVFAAHKAVLISIPVGVWGAGALVYNMDPLWFWRILAYVAVFHFVRQQYGFMRIYARKDVQEKWGRWIDGLAVYSATGYPILYWHLQGGREFSWFVEGDFWSMHLPWVEKAGFVIFWLSILAYLGKEVMLWQKFGVVNILKSLFLLGTYLSWYVGIVAYNSDLVFTLTNVVTHGVPYMALVWAYGNRKREKGKYQDKQKALHALFSKKYVLAFIMLVLLLAYLEEGLWDGLVWKDHKSFFSFFSILPHVNEHVILSLLVPLLAVPQATHYVIDGFIWKLRKDTFEWKIYTLKE